MDRPEATLVDPGGPPSDRRGSLSALVPELSCPSTHARKARGPVGHPSSCLTSDGSERAVTDGSGR